LLKNGYKGKDVIPKGFRIYIEELSFFRPGLLIFIGGLIIAILFFSYFIFPDVMCPALVKGVDFRNQSALNKDPFRDLCISISR
jgi:hypothetical protein